MAGSGLFIIHSAAYDAWAADDAKAVGTRLRGSLRRPPAERTTANKSQASSHAAYRAASFVWPGCQADWNAQLAALGYSTADATTAATVGRTAADAVIAHRTGDGANQADNYADTSGYQPVNPPAPAPLVDPWRWQAQPGQTALVPHWPKVTTFNPNAIPDTQVPNPPRSVSVTADNIFRESAGLNDRKKSIAVYWSDGPGSETPPGHWNLIAQWLSRRHRQTLDQDAKMFLGDRHPGRGAGGRRDRLLGDLRGRRQRGRPVAPLRRHPLAVRGRRGPRQRQEDGRGRLLVRQEALGKRLAGRTR